MKVKIDETLCVGHGNCEHYAGEVYALDDDGLNKDRGKTLEIKPELEEAARRGAELCPELAIKIIESDEE